MCDRDKRFIVRIHDDEGVVASEGFVLGVPVAEFGDVAPGFGAFVWMMTHSSSFDEDDPEEQDRLDAFWAATDPLLGIYDKRPVDALAARVAWEETRERLYALPWFKYGISIHDVVEDEPW
jgi:hypothetical protein